MIQCIYGYDVVHRLTIHYIGIKMTKSNADGIVLISSDDYCCCCYCCRRRQRLPANESLILHFYVRQIIFYRRLISMSSDISNFL